MLFRTERSNSTTIQDVMASALARAEAARLKPSVQVYRKPDESMCDPNCPDCQGTGLVRRDVPFGHPDFGRIFPCRSSPARRKFINEHTGLALAEAEEMAWVDMMLPKPSTHAAEVVAGIISDFYAGVPETPGLIYLHGNPGVGKSMILKIAVAEATRADRRAIYTTTEKILDHIKDAFDQENPSDSALERIKRIANIPLLALDECNRFSPTPFAKNKFFDILNDRHVGGLRGQTMTLIASNAAPIDLFDDAIIDRILDIRNLVIHIPGKSVRGEVRKDYRF